MLIKFQTSYGWRYIDDVYDVQQTIKKIDGKLKTTQLHLFKQKNKIKDKEIVVDFFDVYILNNEGKTIERIC